MGVHARARACLWTLKMRQLENDGVYEGKVRERLIDESENNRRRRYKLTLSTQSERIIEASKMSAN